MDPYIGEIRVVGFNFAPQGWALCNGQLLSISQNQALFSLLGTTFGGDGRVNFGLPNLQGRVPVGVGQLAGGQNYTWGQVGGTESVTLNTQQIPAHNHSATVDNQGGSAINAGNAYLALVQPPTSDDPIPSFTSGTPGSPVQLNGNTIGLQGGGQAHENRQPYLGLVCIIALQGIFPPRS